MNSKACAGLVLSLLMWGGNGLWAEQDAYVEAGPADVVQEEMPERGSDDGSTITFDEDVAGNIDIQDDKLRVVASFFKTAGRVTVLGLAPGQYEIEWETESERITSRIDLADGERRVLTRDDLRRRESDDVDQRKRCWNRRRIRRAKRPGLDLRSWRLTLDSGLWLARGKTTTFIDITDHGFRSDDGGILGGMSVGYRLSPEWMVDLSVSNRLIEVIDRDGWYGDDLDRVSMITTLALGARYYLPPLASRSMIKPYVRAALGPSLGIDVESRDDDTWPHRHDVDHVRTTAVMGGQLGGGIDIQPTSWLVLGTDIAYHVTSRFSEPVGGQKDGTGFTFSFQIGVTIGRRLPRPAQR